MGKTRDLFKKIRDIKRLFHAKMGSIKDRNSMDLTEVEDIKKRWQECTEELYKKDLHDLDNHDDVITHLEPDILECEVKWASEKAMAPHASTLAWKIPWREEPGGLQPMGSLSTTEQLHFHFSLSCIGEGNGNPLQCSCLENPRDGEAWWAAIYGVA